MIDFDTYYSVSYERVRRAMVLTFRDPALAEEITQEAFFQTLRRWPKVSLLDHPEGWTMITALNKGRDLHRRRVRQEAKQPLLIQRNSRQNCALAHRRHLYPCSNPNFAQPGFLSGNQLPAFYGFPPTLSLPTQDVKPEGAGDAADDILTQIQRRSA